MKIIKPSTEILSRVIESEVMSLLELAGRTCYKSEEKITSLQWNAPPTATKFVHKLIESGHEAMIEHFNITVKFICDRGVTHEIVRHRIASYAQESTRYCNYSQDKFGHEITVIEPFFFTQESNLYNCWLLAMEEAERHYFYLISHGASPQEARSVLPNSLKTELIVTMNLREWRHFFKLRTANLAHPQMKEVARPLLDKFKEILPTIFGDII